MLGKTKHISNETGIFEKLPFKISPLIGEPQNTTQLCGNCEMSRLGKYLKNSRKKSIKYFFQRFPYNLHDRSSSAFLFDVLVCSLVFRLNFP
jgi:hypothetical protein